LPSTHHMGQERGKSGPTASPRSTATWSLASRLTCSGSGCMRHTQTQSLSGLLGLERKKNLMRHFFVPFGSWPQILEPPPQTDHPPPSPYPSPPPPACCLPQTQPFQRNQGLWGDDANSRPLPGVLCIRNSFGTNRTLFEMFF
jgi:hypothetical protein